MRARCPTPRRIALLAALLLCAATPAAADYLGNALSVVHEFGYCDGPPVIQPLSCVEVEIVGLGTVVTDSTGNWSVPGSGGARQVNCVLRGPYCHVNENAEGPLASWSGVAQQDVPLTILFDDSNSRQDERNVFDAVNDVHDFIARFDPDLGFINQQVLVRVGVDIACWVSWWEGEMEFSRESFSCANTGELEQVVHYTYGRGLHEYVVPAQGGLGLRAGNSDVLANLMTLDSKIARGLLLGDCVDGVRDSDNDLIYPDDVIGQDEFTAGSVIAGFHWDVLVGLQQLYGVEAGRELAGALWHHSRLAYQPLTQPEQVFYTFVTDDDDGDLSNGTPHYDVLCAAAEQHGFDCPELDLTAAPSETGDVEFVPNPFNPSTVIRFRIEVPGRVRLGVYDPAGRLLRLLIDDDLAAGEQHVTWDGLEGSGAPVSSGVYFYRLETGGSVRSRKLTLLR